MKNDFIIRGKEATLFVEAPPNVGYGSVEVKLDAVDMDLVKSWPGTWFSFIHKSNGQLYIRATAHRVGGKVVNVPGFEQKQPLLHRVISKPERGQNTIFKDGNSLNLTRDNLINLLEMLVPQLKVIRSASTLWITLAHLSRVTPVIRFLWILTRLSTR